MADYQNKKQQSQNSSKWTKINIRFRIRTFYTEIFKEVLKIFQLIVRFGHIHRIANPAGEPHKIWQRSLAFSFPFPVSPAHFRFPCPQLPGGPLPRGKTKETSAEERVRSSFFVVEGRRRLVKKAAKEKVQRIEN